MDNKTALTSLCNAIASSFYPDAAAVGFALFNEGIDPDTPALSKDPILLRVAVQLVLGYVEKSRSEGGASVSVTEDAIRCSIMNWCANYGIDAEDLLREGLSTVEDYSCLW